MNLRRVVCAVGLALAIVASTQVVASAADAPPTYLLSLGDSLAASYQPTDPAQGTVTNTDDGYAEKLYASLKPTQPTLQLIKLGCPGETTTSMITGTKPDGTSCSYGGAASQLQAAVNFLKAHGSQVKYLTNTIGANDVQRCAKSTGLDIPCALQGIATLTGNLPNILGQLKAASAPSTTFVGTNYYNPFLAAYLSSAPNAVFLAALTTFAAYSVNTIEETEYHAVGARVADVAGAFETYNFLSQKDLAGKAVPVDVYNICTMTHECTAGDIHANDAGYTTIARAILVALGAPPSAL